MPAKKKTSQHFSHAGRNNHEKEPARELGCRPQLNGCEARRDPPHQPGGRCGAQRRHRRQPCGADVHRIAETPRQVLALPRSFDRSEERHKRKLAGGGEQRGDDVGQRVGHVKDVRPRRHPEFCGNGRLHQDPRHAADKRKRSDDNRALEDLPLCGHGVSARRLMGWSPGGPFVG